MTHHEAVIFSSRVAISRSKHGHIFGLPPDHDRRPKSHGSDSATRGRVSVKNFVTIGAKNKRASIDRLVRRFIEMPTIFSLLRGLHQISAPVVQTEGHVSAAHWSSGRSPLGTRSSSKLVQQAR